MSWLPKTTSGTTGSNVPLVDGGQAQPMFLGSNFTPYNAASELVEIMNSSSRSMFGNWVQKHRANIASNKLKAITSFVNDYIEYNDAVTNARYRMAINHITLQRMIEGRLEQIEKESQRFRAEHERALSSLRHADEMERAAIMREAAEIERIRTDTYIAKIMGEAQASVVMAGADRERAKAAREHAVVRIIDRLLDSDMSLNDISVVTASMFNTLFGGTGAVDIDAVIKDRLSDMVREKMDEENMTLRARREREQAETRKRKYDIESEIRDDEATSGGPIRSR